MEKEEKEYLKQHRELEEILKIGLELFKDCEATIIVDEYSIYHISLESSELIITGKSSKLNRDEIFSFKRKIPLYSNWPKYSKRNFEIQKKALEKITKDIYERI